MRVLHGWSGRASVCSAEWRDLTPHPAPTGFGSVVQPPLRVLNGHSDKAKTMASQSEKRIIWSPLGQNRFIVCGSSQLTLYDWSTEDSSTHSVASQQCSQPV